MVWKNKLFANREDVQYNKAGKKQMSRGFDMSNAMEIVLGNVCSLLAMVTDSVSSTRKTAKGVLLVQNLSQLVYGIGSVLLRGYSSAVQNAVSIIRNFVAIRKVDSKLIEWTLVVLGVVLGVAFNNRGLVGYLPVIANLQYTLVVFRCKDDERALKIAFAICVGMFVIFNFAILNIVGGCCNLFVMIATVALIIKQESTKNK